MYYSLENAVTGILPSSTPPGDYQVRVTYDGQTSAPQTVTVVAHDFNIATANSAGTGVAQATLNGGLTLTRFTKIGTLGVFGFSPAFPNDNVSLWGTGGGSDPANDTGGSSGDQTVTGNFKVILAGRTITPSYTAAVATYPGLWVMNFKVPADIDPDCYASLQISSGGVLSNPVILPIAAAGQSACSDPSLTPAILAKLDSGGSIIGGAFGIYRQTDTPSGTVVEGAGGAVYRWTPAEWAAGGPARGKLNTCTVNDRTSPKNAADPSGPDATLDAGSRLPLAGPNLTAGIGLVRTTISFGPNLTPSPYYLFSPAAGTFATGGYTLTGNGGPDVGSFSVATTFPANFAVTNFNAITVINRSTPLTINWTGTGIDQVMIQLSTATSLGANNHLVTVFCIAPAAPGTFTVPVSAMAQLQPAATTGTSFGGITVTAYPNPGMFNATLTAGGQLDFGLFGSTVGVTKNIGVQ